MDIYTQMIELSKGLRLLSGNTFKYLKDNKHHLNWKIKPDDIPFMISAKGNVSFPIDLYLGQQKIKRYSYNIKSKFLGSSPESIFEKIEFHLYKVLKKNPPLDIPLSGFNTIDDIFNYLDCMCDTTKGASFHYLKSYTIYTALSTLCHFPLSKTDLTNLSNHMRDTCMYVEQKGIVICQKYKKSECFYYTFPKKGKFFYLQEDKNLKSRYLLLEHLMK